MSPVKKQFLSRIQEKFRLKQWFFVAWIMVPSLTCWAQDPQEFEGDVILKNYRGIEFRDNSGALDGTRLIRYTGNALRMQYRGNSFVFDALDNAPIDIKDDMDQNVIRFHPSGSSFFDSGSIGIGIKGPQSKLHVFSSVAVKALIRADNGGIAITGGNSTNHALRFDDITGVDRHLIYVDANNDVLFGNQNFNNLRFVNNNISVEGANLTVGGDASYKFSAKENEVNKSVAFFQTNSTVNPNSGGEGIIMLNNSISDAATTSISFDVKDPGGTHRHLANISVRKDAGWVAGDASTFRGHMSFWTRPGSGGQLERMRITADGNVGIGTTSPSTLLDVDGTARFGRSDDNGVKISRFTSALNDVPGSTTGIQFEGPVNAHMVFDIKGNDPNDGFHIRVPTTLQGNPVVDKTAFAVKANGKVGIGTTNPSAKLTVNGDILAEKVKVVTSVETVPDYVFKEDYELRSLEEVANYVKTHSHLPEVPSAEEIAADGHDLAEMNLLLLKKIEELTLYVIEQNERLQHQEQRIEELETQRPTPVAVD